MSSANVASIYVVGRLLILQNFAPVIILSIIARGTARAYTYTYIHRNLLAYGECCTIDVVIYYVIICRTRYYYMSASKLRIII